jgi:hypothetical protein
MLKIDILDDNAAREALRKLGDGLPVALSAGLNRTMAAIEQAELNAMETHLHNPIPFTLAGLGVQKSHPRHLDATLYIRPLQAAYLKYPIEGGTLDTVIAPVAVKLNQAGNIPGKRRGFAGIGTRKTDFVSLVKSPGRAQGKVGLWRKQGDTARLLAVVDKGAKREKRLPYYETAQKTAGDRLERDTVRAIEDEVGR